MEDNRALIAAIAELSGPGGGAGPSRGCRRARPGRRHPRAGVRARRAPGPPHGRVLPRRRLGDRQHRDPRRTGAAPGQPGAGGGGVGRLPPGPRAPVPRRAGGLLRRHGVGGRQHRPSTAATAAGWPWPATAPAATSPPSWRSWPGTGAVRAIAFQLLVYPAVDARMSHASIDRERRRLPADQGLHGVVLRALPARGVRRRRPAGVAAQGRLAGRAAAGAGRSPPSSTRCATRARRTPPRCGPPACTATAKRYDGMIHGFIQLGGVIDRTDELMDDCAGALRTALA